MPPTSVKISQLPSDSVPAVGDLVPLVKSATLDTEQTTLGSILALVATATDGWTALPYTPDTVTYNGNGFYSLVFNTVDITGTVSNGMRIKTTRTVNAPTQCTNLNGSTQYYNKTSPAGMTFTDDFVAGGWFKIAAYNCVLQSRYNGTSGWELRIGSTGQAQLYGFNAGSTNNSGVVSYQSVPLNKWFHVAAQLDMSTFTASSTTSYIMIGGMDVPVLVSRGGTNPTALVQAGNYEIGSSNGGGSPLLGKAAQVFVTNAKVTQTTIRGYISQSLTGAETSLISAYSFNNSIVDLNITNANNLTANGSAVATNTDAPWTQDDTATPGGTRDFAIITNKIFSTNTTLTVQVAEGCTIPTSGGVNTVSYSTQSSPYGIPDGLSNGPGRRLITIPILTNQTTSSTSAVIFAPVQGLVINIPGNCKRINVCAFNTSLSSTSSGTFVFEIFNGATQLAQINQTQSNGVYSIKVPLDVVPGTSFTFNLSWLTTAGTATWGNGSITVQGQSWWIETG